MDNDKDYRTSWSNSFQAKSAGEALDMAIAALRLKLNKRIAPDECIVTGPFSPQQRREVALNMVDGVWDITIRWY